MNAWTAFRGPRAELWERRDPGTAHPCCGATERESGGPWNLHQLRHSALTHAAEDGASAPMLMALSGHTNVASVARYAKVSAAALGRWQNDRDPAVTPPSQ
ncbi:MAG: site-specific integrase [Actinomycetota bacterium]|nr:site-specific integrase [Actinomycetota bacterium]